MLCSLPNTPKPSAFFFFVSGRFKLLMSCLLSNSESGKAPWLRTTQSSRLSPGSRSFIGTIVYPYLSSIYFAPCFMVSTIGEIHFVDISWEGMRKTRMPLLAARLYFSMSRRKPLGRVCLPLLQIPPPILVRPSIRWTRNRNQIGTSAWHQTCIRALASAHGEPSKATRTCPRVSISPRPLALK